MTELVYDRNNCVAAGLVQRPELMPGSVVDFDLWKRGVIERGKTGRTVPLVGREPWH